MRCFSLNDQGDVIIEKNDISLAYDGELIRQKIRQILSTNRGEWWKNEKEGIPVQKVLAKNPNLTQIKDYVRSAVGQVDSSLEMSSCNAEVVGRTLKIEFSVSGVSGIIEMEV